MPDISNAEQRMKKRIKQTAVLFTFLLLLLAACGGGPAAVPGSGTSLPGSALEGTTWTMTSLAQSKPLAGAEITAGFMDGELSGSTGCNTYFYTYRTDGLRMILEGGGVTEMACSQPQGVMEQEELFLDYLHQVDQFILSEDGLQLITGDGDVIIFVPRK